MFNHLTANLYPIIDIGIYAKNISTMSNQSGESKIDDICIPPIRKKTPMTIENLNL